MITINRASTNHVFVKNNLVTIIEKGRSYDIFQCEKCGLTGKAFSLTELKVDGRSKKKALNCPKAESTSKIRIIECHAFGKAFGNLTPGSVHVVIDPPSGEDNSRGVWVMGVGEPVKVLFGEYEEIQ